MVRFLPEIGTTIYGKTNDALYINQFIGSEAVITIADTEISIKQETNYPWAGMMNLQVDPEKPLSFAMKIRIPGWVQGELLPGGLYHYLNTKNQSDAKLSLKVNGRRIRKMELKDGYAVIDRKWEEGDRVELELPMDIRVVAGNPRIQDAEGKVVLMRGPVVYCLEEIDNKDFFKNSGKVYLKTNGLQAEYRDDLLNGVMTITGSVTVYETEEDISFTAIPYYAWNNRGQGNMIVWIPDQIN
jgi:DUF1680 family protein